MSQLKGVPRTRIYQMLRKGEVRVNKGRVKQSYRLQVDDVVRIPPVTMRVEESEVRPPAYMLDMIKSAFLYEDEHIIALNKPSGIVVHGGTGRSFGVIEALRHLRSEDENLQLAHRIDQDTSGCLLLSKSSVGLKRLHEALRSHQAEKEYLALLKGDIGKDEYIVNISLKKNVMLSGERLVQTDAEGKHAKTRFTREQVFSKTCLVKANIETGRTHQIRVHAQHAGHPIAGDEKYGDRELNKSLRHAGLKRMFLHASHLKLSSYGSNGLSIYAPLAPALKEFLQQHD